MTPAPLARVLSPEERLQRAQAVVDEALGAFDVGDPYRRALAGILGLVPLLVASAWCVRRPIAVERVVRAYGDRLARLPDAPPSRREVIAARHAAQHTAARSL